MINCTPHAITIRLQDGDRQFPASGNVARVATIETVAGAVDGIPVVTRTTGAVEGLPRDAVGRVLPCLVSGMVLDALRACHADKRDPHPLSGVVFAPDSGATAIRENGQIVAVTRLVTL